MVSCKGQATLSCLLPFWSWAGHTDTVPVCLLVAQVLRVNSPAQFQTQRTFFRCYTLTQCPAEEAIPRPPPI